MGGALYVKDKGLRRFMLEAECETKQFALLNLADKLQGMADLAHKHAEREMRKKLRKQKDDGPDSIGAAFGRAMGKY